MMKILFKEQDNITSKIQVISFFFLTLLLLVSNCCWADGFRNNKIVKIVGIQTINHPTTFKNVNLDLRQGGFVVKNHASIDIENVSVTVTISPSNPFFVLLTSGALTIKNCKFKVFVSGISPDPNNQSLFQLIKIQQGDVAISDSQFLVETFYTVGFLVTDDRFSTSGFQIINNKISNFHGGLYLTNSTNAEIDHNTFANVSFSNIFYSGFHSNFIGNVFTFPGNLFLGDAIDIFDANSVILSNNSIHSGSNYGIFLAGSQNILIDNNKMTDGATYGIYVQTPTMATVKTKNQNQNLTHYFAQLIARHKNMSLQNSNITVSNNYLGQNRFGLAANNVSGLTVSNNVFVQSFDSDSNRLFWTNNNNLLINIIGIVWTNNLYKEAYTQLVPGNNIRSSTFVTFPLSGGVTL